MTSPLSNNGGNQTYINQIIKNQQPNKPREKSRVKQN